MKVAYCGIDIFADCLREFQKVNAEVVKIFAYASDPFDSINEVSAFAEENNIPLSKTPIKDSDIDELSEMNVELLVVAGYAAKIPVTDKFMQVNIHPAMLPQGRGPWPMPVNILRGVSSGITLHKITDKFDEGDIILQKEVSLAENENLETLTGKLQKQAASVLSDFLAAPKVLWDKALPQIDGTYWNEPDDCERLLDAKVSLNDAERIMRAFYGYGVLYDFDGILIEIPYGSIVKSKDDTDAIFLPLDGGWLKAEKYQPYFRRIKLSDKSEVESIRQRYPSKLSDYTFALLYCWQKTMRLQIYLYNDMYVIKTEDYYFCPMGEESKCIAFIDMLRKLYGNISFRFCDNEAAIRINIHYGTDAVLSVCEDDSDYLIPIETLESFPGGKLHKRRTEYHHYRDLIPPPETVTVTKENLDIVKELIFTDDKFDSEAAAVAVCNFEKLGFEGIVVKREGIAVGFMLVSSQYDGIRQAHFCRCVDEEKGAMLYLVRAAMLFGERSDKFINLEDDMGVPGLRHFKQSLRGQLISSYTVEFR